MSVRDDVKEFLSSLDEAEREHLFDLAHRFTEPVPARKKSASQGIRPVVQQVLDASITPSWATSTSTLRRWLVTNC